MNKQEWVKLLKTDVKMFNETREEMIDLRGADLSYADLRNANLSYADLSYADLRGADLRGADLRGANLKDANLRYADLSYADLRNANLSYANLSRANLSRADLSDADLSYADLKDANLRYADLSYADLRGADLRGAEDSGGFTPIVSDLLETLKKLKDSPLFRKLEPNRMVLFADLYAHYTGDIKEVGKDYTDEVEKVVETIKELLSSECRGQYVLLVSTRFNKYFKTHFAKIDNNITMPEPSKYRSIFGVDIIEIPYYFCGYRLITRLEYHNFFMQEYRSPK